MPSSFDSNSSCLTLKGGRGSGRDPSRSKHQLFAGSVPVFHVSTLMHLLRLCLPALQKNLQLKFRGVQNHNLCTTYLLWHLPNGDVLSLQPLTFVRGLMVQAGSVLQICSFSLLRAQLPCTPSCGSALWHWMLRRNLVSDDTD